jgi:regulator of sigma E protease
VAFVVVLGITITVHEFGHFAMAKLLKIRVLVFSLGFGPKLAGFTRGGTEYRLSPFPIGGYVKMAGEAFDDDRKGSPDEFLSHSRWHRFLVAVSGPFMNVLLAIFIFTLSYYVHGDYVSKYSTEPAIVGPVATNSIAKRAGLETGDRIVSVHNNVIKTWEDLELALATVSKDSLQFEVSRNNRTLPLHFDPPKNEDTITPDILGFKFPRSRTIVLGVNLNTPAQKAGLKEGDEILSVNGNGKAGTTFNQILNLISESKGIPLNFKILRPQGKIQREKVWDNAAPQKGSILDLVITPVEEKGRVIIGFMPDEPTILQKFGLIGALRHSIRESYGKMLLTFQIIGRIIKGSASIQTISGPVGIAQISGSAASEAVTTGSALRFFAILGMISLQLGVFNLLPIPILDGGVIALLLIEGLLRRDLSLKLKEKIIQVGFVFLILLFGFVVFNDISKIVHLDRFFR